MNFFKNLLSICFVLFFSASYAQFAFVEDFNDGNNSRGWPQGLEIGICNRTIDAGVYHIESLSEGKFPLSTVGLPVNTDRNFEISTAITFQSAENQGAGLVFGEKDNDNCQVFLLTKSGYYGYGIKENGVWSDVKKWTQSSAIDTDEPLSNTLKVIKQGTELVFKINGTKVFTTGFTPFAGKGLGFKVNNVQSASFDFLKIRYLDSNENHLSDKEIFAREDFYDNHNNWGVGVTNVANVSVGNGRYTIDIVNSSEMWQSNLTVPIDQSRNFEVRVRILKEGGAKDLSYGMLYGAGDMENLHAFIINGEGKYTIGKYENGNFSFFRNRESSEAVNGYATTVSINELKITKRNNTIYYSINEVEVASQPFQKFYGEGIGFLVERQQKIAIDYLEVSYLN